MRLAPNDMAADKGLTPSSGEADAPSCAILCGDWHAVLVRPRRGAICALLPYAAALGRADARDGRGEGERFLDRFGVWRWANSVTAAQRHGATGLGVDFEAQRIVEAKENAKKAGVVDKVTFRKEDLFDTDISSASVLTLYLSLSINIKLRPRILEAMKPGARVLSHDFNMGDWLPDKTERISGRVVYLWIVPAKVAGNWQLTYDGPHGARAFEVTLEQQFQQLEGEAMIDGKAALLRDALVTGDRVGFAIDLGERSMRFDGRVVHGHLEGDSWKVTRK